jgi:hypothetical protein
MIFCLRPTECSDEILADAGGSNFTLALLAAQRPTRKVDELEGDKILSITSERDNGGWLPWFG